MSGFGIREAGMTSGAKFVGEGRVNERVEVVHPPPTGDTMK
jgi:hypothetical protein